MQTALYHQPQIIFAVTVINRRAINFSYFNINLPEPESSYIHQPSLATLTLVATHKITYHLAYLLYSLLSGAFFLAYRWKLYVIKYERWNSQSHK